MSRAYQLSDYDIEAICQDYLCGDSIPQIKRAYRIGTEKVYDALWLGEVQVRPRGQPSDAMRTLFRLRAGEV